VIGDFFVWAFGGTHIADICRSIIKGVARCIDYFIYTKLNYKLYLW
jgi:hypothetical protein